MILAIALTAAFSITAVGSFAAPTMTLAATSTKVAACGANLRTRPYVTAKLKRTIKKATRVTVVAKVTGGRYRVTCTGKTVSSRYWYRISTINGKSVRSLFGVRYVYGAAALFMAPATTV